MIHPSKIDEKFVYNRITEIKHYEEGLSTICEIHSDGYITVGKSTRKEGTPHKPTVAKNKSTERALAKLINYYKFWATVTSNSLAKTQSNIFTFSPGDIFYDKEIQDAEYKFYVVSLFPIGNVWYLGLVSKETGNFLADPVQVPKKKVYTMDDFIQITDGEHKSFMKYLRT